MTHIIHPNNIEQFLLENYFTNLMDMILHAKKFTLRPVVLTDAASIALYANNSKISQNVRDAFPNLYSLEDAVKFIEMTILEETNLQTHFTIDINGAAVGIIGLHSKTDVYRKNMEIGYWLGESFWNQGILTDTVKLVVTYAFSHFEICRIYAGVFSSNPASMRVLEKAGFTCEAVFKNAVFKTDWLLDEYIYSITK